MELTSEEIQAHIAAAIKDNLKPAIDEVLAAQPQPDYSQQYQQPAAPAANPMGDLIAPYFNQANFAAAAANDKADFYSNYSTVKDGEDDIAENTISRSTRVEVEKIFVDLAKQGRPQSREAILDYVVGKQLRTEPKAYADRVAKKSKASADLAKQGLDIGGASATSSLTRDDLMRMDQDKLKEVLGDMTF